MFKTYSSSSSLVITSRWFTTSRLVAPVSVRLVYYHHLGWVTRPRVNVTVPPPPPVSTLQTNDAQNEWGVNTAWHETKISFIKYTLTVSYLLWWVTRPRVNVTVPPPPPVSTLQTNDAQNEWGVNTAWHETKISFIKYTLTVSYLLWWVTRPRVNVTVPPPPPVSTLQTNDAHNEWGVNTAWHETKISFINYTLTVSYLLCCTNTPPFDCFNTFISMCWRDNVVNCWRFLTIIHNISPQY